MTPTYYIVLSSILFTIGAVGVLIRRNAIVLFMCVELMLNAANLALVAFGQRAGNLDGQAVVFFVMAVAAAEVAARADAALQAAGRYVQALHVLGELKDTIACDVTRARDELGYEPATSLVPGMRASIQWCLERGDPL